MSLASLKKKLRSYASPKRKKSNERFFKTGKGEYGYGDTFIGVADPDTRTVARQFHDVPLSDARQLLKSKIHEERSVALRILVNRFEAGDEAEKKRVYDFYLKHFDRVNNWDLVDMSAPKIAGAYLVEHPREAAVLKKYARSKNLWERRLSMLATFAFIRNNQFALTIGIAKMLLSDPHDLTHKAVGWMLREVWKRNNKIVENFLVKNYKEIPRTTLRYAIERMDEEKRQKFLKGY